MLDINFSPFPNLETERLYLRRVDANDAPEIFAMRSDAETMKYIPRPLVANLEEARAHAAMIDDKINNNEGINWAICLKSDPKMIGVIGHYRIKPEHYRSEIGYMLLPDFHGKGYVSEAVASMLEYGFNDMKLHSIEAIIDPGNEASAKVLEKNGFVREAHLKENEYFNGKFLDTVIYSILESTYHTTKSQ